MCIQIDAQSGSTDRVQPETRVIPPAFPFIPFYVLSFWQPFFEASSSLRSYPFRFSFLFFSAYSPLYESIRVYRGTRRFLDFLNITY